MKQKLLVLAVVALSCIAVGVGSAAQPTNPGLLRPGRRRVDHENSGAEWGVIASTERKGDNSSINATTRPKYCS